MTAIPPRQMNIRSIMVGIVGLAPFLALIRLDPYLGTMAAAHVAVLAILFTSARVTERATPALALAVATDLAVILPWLYWRMAALMAVAHLRSLGALDWFRDWLRVVLADPFFVRVYAAWEAWSLLRWWCLFGLLTWIFGRREGSDRPMGATSLALLRFAPWLLLLEFGFLMGGLIVYGDLEISTYPIDHMRFHVAGIFPTFRLSDWPLTFVRCAVPSLVVGWAYFRAVLDWRRGRSLLGAVAFVPVATALSIAWFTMYEFLRRMNFAP